MIAALVIGFLFGFIGSMPVAGPIAVLIVARSIEERHHSAFMIGMGSVIAEMLYAFFAFWGFAKLLETYAWIDPVSRGVAAIILVALGVVFWRGKTSDEQLDAPSKKDRGWASFALGFSISGFNPTLLATWAGAAGTLSASGLVEFKQSLAWPFGIGAGIGIGLWYVLLIRLMKRYKSRFRTETLHKVLRFFGAFLVVVGLWFGYMFVDYLVSGPTPAVTGG